MRRLGALSLLLLGAVACSDADPGASWQADVVSAENARTEGADVPLPNGWTARFGRDCGQLELGDVRTHCPEFTSNGGLMTPLQWDDERVVWILQRSGGGDPDADASVAPIDHAVVWSSTAPEGRRVAAAIFGDFQQVAWVLDDGEEPWGMQLIDARGRLIAIHNLVGLSGR